MPYRCAFYKQLAIQSNSGFEVIFLDSWGVDNTYDPTFGEKIMWDNDDMLSFKHSFCKTRSLFKTKYSGADKVGIERTPVIGSIFFYFRTFFGLISFDLFHSVFRKDFEIIIVEAYYNFNFIIISLLAKMKKKTLVFRGEAYFSSNKRNSIFLFFKSIFLRNFFKLFDVVCYSSSSNKEYFKAYNVPGKKLVFVPSAVDDDFFRKRVKRKGSPCNDDYFNIVGAGRFVERKRWIDLLKAVNLISDPQIRVFLVGNGPLEGELKSYVKSENLKGVFFPGFKNQSEITEYYNLADIIAFTSDYDPTPKVLNEALIFGLPILVSDKIGTAKDLCVNNGYIYKCGNINDLAKKIEILKQQISIDPSKLRKASVDLSKEWTVKKGAKNLLDLLMKLSKQHHTIVL